VVLREAVVTNRRCNQACGFCDARRPVDDLREIQLDAVRGRIDRSLARGARELVLTGGEPTMRADLARLVAHVRAGGATPILDTNAALIGEPQASALAAAGLALARVHLPAWGDAADRITRDIGGSTATRRGLRALLAAASRSSRTCRWSRPTSSCCPGY
jgi:molybdenum cofactor biosynthesis enzyme MoaA